MVGNDILSKFSEILGSGWLMQLQLAGESFLNMLFANDCVANWDLPKERTEEAWLFTYCGFRHAWSFSY